jgi:hypothetical protein
VVYLQGPIHENLEYLRLTQPVWPLMIGHSHLWPISVICGPFQIQLHVSVAMYLSYNDQIGSKGHEEPLEPLYWWPS